MPRTVTLRQLTTGTEAWALGAAWDDLLTRSAANVIFLTCAFQSLWWETLGEGDLRVLVGEDEAGAPFFIAPLYLSSVDGLGRTVRLLGGVEVADYLDLVAGLDDLETAWRLTLDHLAAGADWEAIELRALPEWSPSRAIVDRLAAAAGWSVEETVDDVCPVLALPPTWEDYLAGLRSQDRHELRRKINRLGRLAGQERFSLLGPDDDLAAAIDDFLALHRQSGQVKAGFWDERRVRFFHRLLAVAHAHGWLRLAFQEIDGVRAAAVLAFRYGDRYYVYNSGYDPAYRALAAGVVCMARTIQAAIAEGAASFDLLQGDERYKYDLGAVATHVYRLLVRRPAR